MPDAPHIQTVHPSFAAVVDPQAPLRLLAGGLRFTEGPAWWGGRLVFSDIPADTIYEWRGGPLSVFRKPSRHANGNAVDAAGRLVTCEHGSRTVTRTSPGGDAQTLAATHAGKRLNSPNDVTVKSDGTIWFTDPPYGINPDQVEQAGNYVFRLPADGGEPAAVIADMSRPNGLCFSPDERVLYVGDSDTSRHHVRRWTVTTDGRLEGGEVFATIAPGVPDGMKCDRAGRLFVTAGDGVQMFSAAGELLGKILTPRAACNCCLGGADGRTLFITANDSVWAIDLRE